jgi:hypothetical protein
MLHYVECGVEFTNDFGDISEGFYSSLESVYYDALVLIDKNDIHEKYKIQAYEILNETENIGWGFHDFLCQSYSEFYN